MDLPRLNLPEYDFRVYRKSAEWYIWDPFRKKEILLTPEEWVRQNFLQLMINQLRYPGSWIRVESGLQYDKRSKRTDIVLLHRNGDTFLLVECKAPHIRLDSGSLRQVSLYNKTLMSDYVAVTNGMRHYFWSFEPDENRYVSMREAPVYPGPE